MVRLESVFWDHPEFANEPGVRGFLAANPDTADRVWMLTRFLEHGRFVDTVLFATRPRSSGKSFISFWRIRTSSRVFF